MQAFFIIYDLTTGDLKRHGKCPAEHMASQARSARNEGVRLDINRSLDEAKELLLTQRLVIPASGQAPYLRRRATADIEARRPKPTKQAPGIDQRLRVLETKLGIAITPADLATAQPASSTAIVKR